MMHWCEPMLNCLDCFVGIYTANKMMIALVGKYTRILTLKVLVRIHNTSIRTHQSAGFVVV